MSDPAPKPPASIRAEVWQAYLDAPEHMVAEILDGELSLMPRPRPRHASVAGRLRRRLGGFDDPDEGDPGGWLILVDAAAIAIAPDWVCEVLSDRTRSIDRVKKQRIYHRAGVLHVWHVDPDARTFEVFRRETEGWTRVLEAADAEVVRAPLFEAIEIDLARLWSV